MVMMTWKAIITVVKKVVVLFWADDAGDVGNGSGDSAFPPWNCYVVVNFKMPAMIMLKLTIISKCWMLLSVISRIIKTEVWVICWGWRLTQITQTRGACILGRLWIQHNKCNICCRYWVIMSTSSAIKQLLNEVEYDVINNQRRDLSYLPKPKVETDNTHTRFDNSWYHAKTGFNNCFTIHFSNNLQKKTLHRRGAWKLGRLWTRN